jgi:hypothetical protein
MKNINNGERIIKEKSQFIESNAVKLYHMRGLRGTCASTIEEDLVSILLSDRPLTDCPKYEPLNVILNNVDEQEFSIDENENYPLKVIFSATRYINSVTDGEENAKLKDKMRKYLRYIDTRSMAISDIKIDEEDVKKVLKKI